MSKQANQLNWVKNKLLYDGEISRNEALQNFISRLSGYILKLKKEGWEISDGEYRKEHGGKNYYYTLISSPFKKVSYKVVGTDKVITRFEKV
jgi:hypothetical protein